MTEERQSDPQVNPWQIKLLPWMIAMPTALIAIFIYLSTKQLNEFNESINAYRSQPVVNELMGPAAFSGKGGDPNTNLEYVKFYSRLKLEERALDHRYAQTGFLLIARTYTKYLGFFTGMVLAMVAAVFIISKIKEDTSNIEGTASEEIRFKIASSSPGIIFGILGTVLMMATILYNPEIQQIDSPLYLIPEIQTSGGNVGFDKDKKAIISNLGEGSKGSQAQGQISLETIIKSEAGKDSAQKVQAHRDSLRAAKNGSNRKNL